MITGNARSFHNVEPNSGESENTWYTPLEVMSKLGMFDLDPCTNSSRPFDTAISHVEHDTGTDGFGMEWEGRVFCNPPYGKHTGKWLNKMSDHGNGIALVFNRLDTVWAQEEIPKSAAVIFLKGRIRFIRKDGKAGGRAACGSILLAYGKNNIKYLNNFQGLIFNNLPMQNN